MVVKPSGILYTKVKPKRVEEIVEKTLLGGEVIRNLLYKEPVTSERIEKYDEVPFYKNQVRVAMRNIGRIDPTDILDAIAQGAYSGVAKVLFEMTSDEVIGEVAKIRVRLSNGKHRFELSVLDDDGVWTTDTTFITVQ